MANGPFSDGTAIGGPFSGGTSGEAVISSDAIVPDITGGTLADPSNIIDTITQDGDDITIVTNGTAISNDPSTAGSILIAELFDIYGNVADFDLTDVLRVYALSSVLAPPTDFHFGISLESADDQRGSAWRLAAVSGDWRAEHTTKTAGTWGTWVSGSALTNTQAFEGAIAPGNGTSQGRTSVIALAADGTPAGATGNTSATANNIGSDLTKLRLFAGYVTGTGGSAGSFTFKPAYVLIKRLTWSTLDRFFV